MPERIQWLTRAHYQDPLVDYGATDYVIQFDDAASLLQQWRNPHLGRASREGTLLGIASNAKNAKLFIEKMILSTNLSEEQEKQLADKLKVYSFLLERTLPEALELINRDMLNTPEDILKFIQQHLKLMNEQYEQKLLNAESIISKLSEITDLEVSDEFGKKKRVQRDEVIETIGRALGSLLEKQSSLRPIDGIEHRPRGKLLGKETYKAGILRTRSLPPTFLTDSDIRVLNKDRLSLIYFVVDVSQSMGRKIFSGGLTRIDGALLTSLGLFYFFNLANRKKRREIDNFKMHLVPVVEVPYIIEENDKLENFLFEAEAKGKTRIVHCINAIYNHVKNKQKSNDYDVQIVILTDGRPNVPLLSKIPGYKDKRLLNHFDKKYRGNLTDTHKCMMQLNQYFNFLRVSKDREWSVSYFLMAKESVKSTNLYSDTEEMLLGITKPIVIDPSNIKNLGSKIIKETMK